MARSDFYLTDPDATASIVLWPTDVGGRNGPFRLTDELRWFGCPLFVETVGHGFDVRMEPDSLEVHTLVPGGVYQMRMKFLSPETAIREFTPGRTFRLWSGGAIGLGEIRQAFFSDHRKESD